MRRCLILIPMALIICAAGLTENGQQRNNPSPAKRQPQTSLSGIWIDNGNGREVTVAQTGSSVKATYDDEYHCSRGKKEPTDIDFDEATLNGDKIVGRMSVCVYGQAGVENGTVRKVPVKLTIDPDGKSMSGSYGTYGGRDDANTVSFTRCSCWRGVWTTVATLATNLAGDDPQDIVTVNFSFSVASNGTVKGSGTATLGLSGFVKRPNRPCVVTAAQAPDKFPVTVEGNASSDQMVNLVLRAPGITGQRTFTADCGDVRETKSSAFSPWGLAEGGFENGFTIRLEDGQTNKTRLQLERENATLTVETEVKISERRP